MKVKHISEDEFKKLMKEEKEKNKERERVFKLKQERDKYRRKFKLPSTSKLIAAYLFLTLNAVLIYSMVAMWAFQDLSYLGVLITDVAGQVLTYLIYARKSTVENSYHGITYELAMMDKQRNIESAGLSDNSENSGCAENEDEEVC